MLKAVYKETMLPICSLLLPFTCVEMNAALRKQGLPGYTPKGVATAELGYMETILSQLLKEQTLHDPSQWRDVVPM